MSSLASSPSPAPATSQPASVVDMRDRPQIERAAAFVLALLDQGHVQYMPLLARLERELDELDKSESAVARMRRRLAA